MNGKPRWLAALGLAVMIGACQQAETPAPSTATESYVEATAAEHEHDAPIATPIAETPPAAPVLEQELAYGEGRGSNLVGYLAMPGDAAEPLPGIILIHEWWGLNDNIKAMARRLAGEGYVALAVDLYGGVTADTPDQAQSLMTAVLEQPDAARANLRQAYEYLEKYALAPRIGSIGWCLGGAWSLETAVLYPESLDAMVMYYGQVIKAREQLATLNMPILGFFGSEDKSIPVRDVQEFRATLLELRKNADIRIVVGADHAFANPSGGSYDERAANEAWDETLAFFRRNLKLDVAAR